ncbi:IS5 family transposase [Streptomyces sp. NPDC006332]|uniref:IS5 family transposase n=1 Tax=Streptomyces sp. NPDC006332 TaxID=3155456 RepID=UPI0033A525B3
MRWLLRVQTGQADLVEPESHPARCPHQPLVSQPPDSYRPRHRASNCRIGYVFTSNRLSTPRPPARRQHGPKRGKPRQDEPDDHALGRSRGGLTTKIHLACDGQGRPLAILITPGRRHDSVCAQPLLERIRVPHNGVGRPRCRPDHAIADKAYSSRGFRAYLRKRGIAQTIPEKTDRRRHRHHRGRRGGRPPAFDRQIYRRRNVVEHCFNRLKGFRGIATRYDKTATSYEAAVSLASVLLWARSV